MASNAARRVEIPTAAAGGALAGVHYRSKLGAVARTGLSTDAIPQCVLCVRRGTKIVVLRHPKVWKDTVFVLFLLRWENQDKSCDVRCAGQIQSAITYSAFQ